MTTQLTKKQVILQEYIRMQTEIRQACPGCVQFMPPVEEVDVVDFLFYFNLFCNGNPQDGYRDVVRMYLSTQGIEVSPEDFERGYPIVEKFLAWIRELR